MANPIIKLLMKGDLGDEIVNYGYVNHLGAEIMVEADVRLTTRMTEYAFQVQEPKPPKAAWVEFTNNEREPGEADPNVRMGGLWYDDIDMWDPTYEDWPGNNDWNEGQFAKGTEWNKWANEGGFLWSGLYRMGFDLKKLPTPKAPPKSSPPKPWNPLESGFWSMDNMAMWVYVGVVAVVLLGLVYMFLR